MKGASCTEFLGVILDENTSWKKHLKYTENRENHWINVQR